MRPGSGLLLAASNAEIVIPRDSVAHKHHDLADAAPRMMEINMAAHHRQRCSLTTEC